MQNTRLEAGSAIISS